MRAQELIEAIEQSGGNIRVEGGNLKISPRAAALPMMKELRARKPEIIAVLQRVQKKSREYRRASFTQWVEFSCVRHPRCFGGITSLHRSFVDYLTTRNEYPCSLETFRGFLLESDYLIGEIKRTMLVSGLVLRPDVDGLELETITPTLNIPFETDARW